MVKKLTEKKSGKFLLILLGFVFLFILIRVVGLTESFGFGSDEGRDFLTTWNIYKNSEITLIGPPSEFTVSGREFYFGPASYYVILLPLIISQGDPVFVSYFLVILNALAFLFALFVISKYLKDKFILYSFAIILTFTPPLIQITRSYWNPNFMLPTSLILLGLLLIARYRKSNHPLLIGMIGFILGLGLQFHYSFIFAIAITFGWLIYKRQMKLLQFAAILAGGILGFLPIILFELRNNFYNIRTFLLVLTQPGDFHSDFHLSSFYLISIIPFVTLLSCYALHRTMGVNKRIVYLLLTLFIGFSLFQIATTPQYIFNYPTLKKVAEIINKDNPTQFNIVDQLTRDNRAMALRYMMTIRDKAPLGVMDYPHSKTLYVYTQEPIKDLLKAPVWEISSAMPLQVTDYWRVTDKITLYKLVKY